MRLAMSNQRVYFSLSGIRLISNLLFSQWEDQLVLRFLPKDVYEDGKDHPAPSLPKQILCLLLLSGNPGVQRMEEPGMEQ